MSKKKEKGFFLTSLENFWYYYKWPFLGGIVIFFGVIIFMLNMTETEEPSDVDITAVFARPLTVQEFTFQPYVESVVSDADANGTIRVQTKGLYITEGGKTDTDLVSMNNFDSAMAYGEGDLVLLDGANLSRYQSKDFLASLSDYVDVSQFAEENLIYRDGKAVAVRLKNSKILTDMQFIIDDVYAGIMFVPEMQEEQVAARRENAAKVLLELCKTN